MREHVRVRGRVWDLPVRLFHWLLVALLVFQVVTGKIGGRLLDWHLCGGYARFVLVVFRVLWGFAGSTSARFASFLVKPAAALRFGARLLARRAETYAGHNPLGGWMVVGLLVSLAFQITTGLFSNDGGATTGALAGHVSIELSDRLTELHHFNFWVLLLLAALHTAAALYHWLVLREDLIAAMFTGEKALRADETAVVFVSAWRGLLALGLALLALLVVLTV